MAVDVDVVAVGIRRESLRQHGHLDVAGNAQLASNALLLGVHLLFAMKTACRPPDDEDHQGQADEHQYAEIDAHPMQVAIYFAFNTHYGHRPASITANGCIEHQSFLPLLVHERSLSSLA